MLHIRILSTGWRQYALEEEAEKIVVVAFWKAIEKKKRSLHLGAAATAASFAASFDGEKRYVVAKHKPDLNNQWSTAVEATIQHQFN